MKPAYDEIKRLLGDIDDHTIAEIEASGITLSELEEVAAHLADQTDVMGGLRRPLTGAALAVFEILQRQASQWEQDN